MVQPFPYSNEGEIPTELPLLVQSSSNVTIDESENDVNEVAYRKLS